MDFVWATKRDMQQQHYTIQPKSSRTFRPQTLSTPALAQPPATTRRQDVQRPDVWNNHRTVYDALLVLLNMEGFAPDATKTIFYRIDPAIRRRVAAELGISELEIFFADAETVHNLKQTKGVSVRNVPRVLSDMLDRDGLGDFIPDNHIVEIPNRLHSRQICSELEELFGRDELLRWPGFIEDDHDYDRQIFLNINPKYAAAGFMVPIFRQGGRIEGFWCYRHPKDANRFKLSSKREGIADA